MEITRTSTISGITRTMDLPITEAQWENYMSGALIQNAFPHIKPADREFIKTGITGEEWDELFAEERKVEPDRGDEEDDDDDWVDDDDAFDENEETVEEENDID